MFKRCSAVNDLKTTRAQFGHKKKKTNLKYPKTSK